MYVACILFSGPDKYFCVTPSTCTNAVSDSQDVLESAAMCYSVQDQRIFSTSTRLW